MFKLISYYNVGELKSGNNRQGDDLPQRKAE